MSVAIRLGTPNSAYVLRHALPDSAPVLARAERELIDALLGGDVDAVVVDRMAAGHLVDQGLPVVILGPNLSREQYALALSAQRPRLRQEIERHLRDLERESYLAGLAAAYELEPLTR